MISNFTANSDLVGLLFYIKTFEYLSWIRYQVKIYITMDYAYTVQLEKYM